MSQQPVALPFAVGEIIAGKYEVGALLGSGGMGYVISARHVELGEMVALKFLRPEALVHPELVERFSREARAAAKIRSEHVANVFDVGALADGTPYIVMEYLAGKDLADYLHQEGPLPISVAVEYVMQACEALAAAHAHGIVHRDIKPENLFLTQQAQGMPVIKVLDFGISKIALPRGKRDLVRTQMPLGSPVYMSPEQIRSSDQVDARSDIWAVGCVLFELLTGVTAFDEPSLLELSAAILEREPVPLQTLRPDASAELEDVLLRCLQKDPDQRYQHIAELAAALYPFAPRRARISAERCYHMLKNAGVISTDLSLNSAHPPAPDAARTTTSRGARELAARTTTPAAIDLTVEDDVPVKRSRSKAALLALGVVGLAAAAALALGHAATTDKTAAAAAPPLKGSTLAAAPPTPPASPVTTRVLDLDDPANAGSVAPKQLPLAGSPQHTKRPKPTRAPRAIGAKHTAGDDDLDPGF